MMTTNNPAQFFKTLIIIYVAMLVGQLLFGGLIWWLLQQQETKSAGIFSGSGLLVMLVVGCAALISLILNRSRSEKGADLKGLPQKLMHYRTTCIFRWAFLEMGNMVAIIFAFLDQNSTLLLFFALGIGLFLLARPSNVQFAEMYHLTPNEEQEILPG
ncbi:MAG: hypothetical protein R2830_17680 [Saprospiraceae bacterium]